MSNIQNEMRAVAKELLESGKATVVLGWEKGTMPYDSTPVMIRSAADVDKVLFLRGDCNYGACRIMRCHGDHVCIGLSCFLQHLWQELTDAVSGLNDLSEQLTRNSKAIGQIKGIIPLCCI